MEIRVMGERNFWDILTLEYVSADCPFVEQMTLPKKPCINVRSFDEQLNYCIK